MKTSWKPLGRSLLFIAQGKHGQKVWCLIVSLPDICPLSYFKRGREGVEDDGRSGRPKDATADENVKVVHTQVMCDKRRDLRRIASEVSIRFVAVQSILTDILGMSTVRQHGCLEC